MAVTTLTCPQCRAVMRTSAQLIPGRMVKCPRCHAPFPVPASPIPVARPVVATPEPPSSNMLLPLIAAGAGFLIVVVGVGSLTYFLMSGGSTLQSVASSAAKPGIVAAAPVVTIDAAAPKEPVVAKESALDTD